MKKTIIVILALVVSAVLARAENGYRLWLRYDLIKNAKLLNDYRQQVAGIYFGGNSPTLTIAANELQNGLGGLLGRKIDIGTQIDGRFIVAGKPADIAAMPASIKNKLQKAGSEGYIIETTILGIKPVTIITGNTDVAVLYGVFNYLRLLQTEQTIQKLSIVSIPGIKHQDTKSLG